jgi:hypothetical protein
MWQEGGTLATVASEFNVVGFAGSLRRGSYNAALLRAATQLTPPTLHIVIYELDGIPLYNADIEATGAPPSVVQLRDAIPAGGWVADRHARVQPRRARRAEEHDRLAVQAAAGQRVER